MQAPASWCSFSHEGRLCTATNCSHAPDECRWPHHSEATGVIFSDRLLQTGMVAMTSLCRHPSLLTVLVLTHIGANYQPLPRQYLSCRIVTMSLADALAHLRKVGWTPDAVCDPPGTSRLGLVTESTLLGALPWDKDSKHAACANHLRFYLPEFPALRKKHRTLFIDDDVVIMQDPVKDLMHQHLPEGVLITANCDVNHWNGRCQRFDISRRKYFHFFANVVAGHGAWSTVLEVLKNTSDGAWRYDASHIEWNFGFNLVELDRHRTFGFTAKYERLASQMLQKRYIRGDSLIYGLGMAFFAYQDRVLCYERQKGFHVLDGLGYVPPPEMGVAGVGPADVARASVLHFNGERKPWGDRPYPEYVKAMGDWGQATSPYWPPPSLKQQQTQTQTQTQTQRHQAQQSEEPARPLSLAILLSGPRTGTEWMSKVLSDDRSAVCGSLDDRTEPHPESLMPFSVVCSNASQVPCTAWSVEPLPNSSCDLRLMCQWRYVLAAARGVHVFESQPSGGGGMTYQQHWRKWGRKRSATEVFEGYLKRMMRLPTGAPELPCRCDGGRGVLFLKFFLAWLEPREPSRLKMPENTFQRRFARDAAQIAAGGAERAFDLVDARAVFERLGARVLFFYRDPIAQYVSIQRGRINEIAMRRNGNAPSGGDAWHCFEANASLCEGGGGGRGHEPKMEIDVRDAGFFLLEARRLQELAGSFKPAVTRSIESCVAQLDACIQQVYTAIALPHRNLPIAQPRVTSSLHVIKNREAVEAMARDVEAGNWTPGPLHPTARRQSRGGAGGGVSSVESDWRSRASARAATRRAPPVLGGAAAAAAAAAGARPRAAVV